MVVEAATIVADGLDLFAEKVEKGIEAENNSGLFELVEKLKNEDKYEMIKDVLVPENYNLIVTPKEIDDLIENMKDVVARGINFSM
ncbi:MAG: GPR endopeptidase [Oscillospiraceae bacterium]|nr:GPR endopeptidase [Oscillospiraceae bacterium]